jgi:hypothetical protein
MMSIYSNIMWIHGIIFTFFELTSSIKRDNIDYVQTVADQTPYYRLFEEFILKSKSFQGKVNVSDQVSIHASSEIV